MKMTDHNGEKKRRRRPCLSSNIFILNMKLLRQICIHETAPLVAGKRDECHFTTKQGLRGFFGPLFTGLPPFCVVTC